MSVTGTAGTPTFIPAPVSALNDQILGSAGSHWADWEEISQGWLDSPKADEFRDRATASLAAAFGDSWLFVLRDPRICRLMPFWTGVLAEAGIEPFVIHIHRDPLAVAAALETSDGIDPAMGQLLWLRHVLDAEQGSRGLPRHFTSHDVVLRDWPGMAARAQDDLGLPWPRLSVKAGVQIDAFLAPLLGKSRPARDRVTDTPLVWDWIRDTNAILQRWAATGETAKDHPLLDAIRGQLNAAGPVFSGMIDAAGATRKAHDDLAARLAESQATQTRAEEALAEARAALATATAEKATLNSRLGVAAERAAHDESALAEARAALAAATAQRADLDTRLTQARERAAQAEAARESAMDRIAFLESSLAQRSAETEEGAARLREAQSALAQAVLARDEATAHLADLTHSLSGRDAETARTIAALQHDSQQHAAQLEDEIIRLGDEAQSWKLRNEEAQAALTGAIRDRDRLTAEIARLTRLNVETAEATATRHAAAMKEATARIAALQRDLHDQTTRLDKVTAKHAEVLATSNARKKHLLDAAARQTETAERTAALTAEIARLGAELAASQQAQAALRASLSWRIGAPLRWVSARLPGRRPSSAGGRETG